MLDSDLHLFVLMLRPFSHELVIFPDFEFQTPLGISILIDKQFYVTDYVDN